MVLRKMTERKPRVENAFLQFDTDGFGPFQARGARFLRLLSGFITVQKLKRVARTWEVTRKSIFAGVWGKI